MNNDIYETLNRNLNNELDSFNEELLLNKIEENEFSNNILFHSNSMAYNYAPFYKELRGYSLDILKSGKPKKFDNKNIYFGDNTIQKIERYGKTGKLTGTHYIIEEKEERHIISIDNFNNIERYIKVLFKEEYPIESYEIEDAQNGVATLYLYNNNKIQKSLSFEMSYGITRKSEEIYHYDEHDLLDSISSIVDGQQGVVYKK